MYTLQLLLCHPPHPLCYPFQDIAAIVPPLWLTTTWEFLKDNNSIITPTDPWYLTLDRHGDYHIIPQVPFQLVHIPNPFCPSLTSKSSRFAASTSDSSLFMTLQSAKAMRVTVVINTWGQTLLHLWYLIYNDAPPTNPYSLAILSFSSTWPGNNGLLTFSKNNIVTMAQLPFLLLHSTQQEGTLLILLARPFHHLSQLRALRPRYNHTDCIAWHYCSVQ